MTCKDIKKVIGSLNNTKSTGFTDISMYAVKKLWHIIVPWLKRILILSFETGVWPDFWKLAKITPVRKGGEEHVLSKYRPVALLPVLSKVVEKVMVNQLCQHLETPLPISADGWQRTSLLDSNRLKLNAEKTKIMVMSTKQKDVHKDLKVFLKGVEIERVTFAKFLGIIISGNLKWNEYILQSENSLLKYCNKRLAALKLPARECSLNQRKILAHGLVISKIMYCISCWASGPGYLKKRVQEVMSETTKIVYGSRTVPLK